MEQFTLFEKIIQSAFPIPVFETKSALQVFKRRRQTPKTTINLLCLPLQKWSSGRAVRQRSAKPCTAVQIRSRPQQSPEAKLRGFYFYAMQTDFVCDCIKIKTPGHRRWQGFGEVPPFWDSLQINPLSTSTNPSRKTGGVFFYIKCKQAHVILYKRKPFDIEDGRVC